MRVKQSSASGSIATRSGSRGSASASRARRAAAAAIQAVGSCAAAGLDQEQPGGASVGDEREEPRPRLRSAEASPWRAAMRRAEPGTQPRQFGLFGRLPQQPPAGGRDVSLFRQGHSEERVALERRLAAERGAKLTGGPVEPPGEPGEGILEQVVSGRHCVNPGIDDRLGPGIIPRDDDHALAPLLGPLPAELHTQPDGPAQDRDRRQPGLTPLLMAIEKHRRRRSSRQRVHEVCASLDEKGFGQTSMPPDPPWQSAGKRFSVLGTVAPIPSTHKPRACRGRR